MRHNRGNLIAQPALIAGSADDFRRDVGGLGFLEDRNLLSNDGRYAAMQELGGAIPRPAGGRRTFGGHD